MNWTALALKDFILPCQLSVEHEGKVLVARRNDRFKVWERGPD